MSSEKDAYQVLGVHEEASTDDIKSAFRAKAFELHPDSNTASTSDRKQFQELLEAYEILRDPAKRASYDALRRMGGGIGPSSGGAGGEYWDWPRSASNQQAWESAFDEWLRRHGADFQDFGESEQVKRERANAEIRAKAAAWEREKAGAAANKLRMERVQAKAEDARHARQAATLRKFWQTRSGVTWQDGVIVTSFLLCVTLMVRSSLPTTSSSSPPAAAAAGATITTLHQEEPGAAATNVA